MAPRIEEFWATDAAQDHMLSKHGVDVNEAIEAADSTRRHVRTYNVEAVDPRYMLAGKTFAGRRLFVVFEDEGEGVGRILTAREATGRRAIAQHKKMRGD